MVQENEIISLLRKKDQRGMTFFYQHYADALLGIISRIVKNTGAAEDVLQQSLLKIWDKIDQYDEDKSALFTWASIIARNTALDKVRLVGYQQRSQTAELNEEVTNVGVEHTSDAGIDTSRLLGKLDQNHAILIQKVYLEGYTQSAIATELNIPLGTVKTRIRAAIKELREELKNEKSLFIGSLALIVYLIYKLMS